MIALLAALLIQDAAAPDDLDLIAELIASRQEAVEATIETEADLSQAYEAPAGNPQNGCLGEFIEGGTLICRFQPNAHVALGAAEVQVGETGIAVLAIPRQASETLDLVVSTRGVVLSETHAITQREYNLQRVDGVPQRTVTPDPSTLPRRQREYAQKQAAFNSVWDGQGFLDGFIQPAEGITTGVYGSARVYNDGHEGSPHWGLDWANDTGTPVVAPAGGRVVLAEADMYYEGGLIFIDHGQGLVSAFLHMSAVHVAEGDMVEQGELIGEIGAGGRATGPHLDWRVKLRNGFYVDPGLLLELDVSGMRD
jgi:murein DD-endopeptidase MepM/ murein hydrolase activator NlpD